MNFTAQEHVVFPKASPCGRLAYMLRRQDVENNRYTQDLYLYPDTLLYTNMIGYWWQGERLLVQTGQGFYHLNPETGEKTPLQFASEFEELLPLPDGRLLFTAEDGPAQETCIVTETAPFWAEGRGFIGSRRIRLFVWEGGKPKALTDQYTDVEQLWLSACGQWVYFLANRYTDTLACQNRLLRLSLTDGSQQDCSVAPAPFMHHSFAVVGQDTLAVCGTDMAEYGINACGNYYWYTVSEGEARLIDASGLYTPWNSAADDRKPPCSGRWAVQGGSVYFAGANGHDAPLVRLTGQGIQRAAKGVVLDACASDKEIYFTALDATGSARLHKLSETHKYMYAAKTQPVGYINSEGCEIEGWILPPADFVPGKKYPAVLCIHGGPRMLYTPEPDGEKQYLSAAGYAVLWCNPRGSDGRGDEFADIRGSYGKKDAEDILGFLDTALAACSWLDKERLAVMGGSYGGYLVNWLISHTSRFKAAVSERGISNWVSMQGTSDIGPWFVPDQTGLAGPDSLWKVSPLRMAANIDAPTLFIHGGQDKRCPLGETTQMYSTLRMRGVAARLCIFPQEGHNYATGGKPKTKNRRLQEIAAWFEKYL